MKIIFQDKREPIRGYLYSATDSTIILIPTNSKYQITESSAKLEIPISQIKKVNKSVKKAATIGFIPGFIGGAMFGVYGASWGGSNTPLISYISTGLAIGIIYGTITALASTFISRKVYSIKGDIAKYRSKHLGTLQMRSNSNIELIAK